MNITINGHVQHFENDTSLNAIIEESCEQSTHIVAEVNGDVIDKFNWPGRIIREGDKVELLKFVGGG